MADTKKSSGKKGKTTRKKAPAKKKREELSPEELGKVAGGMARKRARRLP